ncbi:polyketide cyclase/dehydrase and lipid transportsuperfamily protein [Striga asiatica]|uniref:Polyketide cyclase/dehydrase and lipid transportsuperfamily protein n=1 Tax=Striga asiatica TaxID=4170 RepID=A0A5A7NYX7_STRAF|nr:polyketide cyclase/dehydrase and lipid transportsuperfamily protein [Striga asiatica]
MASFAAFLEILQRPTIGDVIFELLEFMAPIWVAIVVGVLVGWAWKPKWADKLNADFLDHTSNKVMSKTSAINPFPQFTASIPSLSLSKLQIPARGFSWISDVGLEKDSSPSPSVSDCSSSKAKTEESSVVNEDDVKHLHRLVEEKDGGPSWIKMMERSTPNMSYQAWRRDPKTGPPQYRSRTVYEDTTPEMVRDFFWDDEFRLKWDDMLITAKTLNECPTTGTMMVQWVRKFPFFCSDREYIIGRRIWESGRRYYCVTKGVPCSSVPRCNKPRRVDLYYSSWFIRAAESKRDGRPTACEVVLFHHEDMGIPWEIAKLGIRHGMWGAVKMIDPGLRAYHKHRALGVPLSPSAAMAQINSKFSASDDESLELEESPSKVPGVGPPDLDNKPPPSRGGFPKMLVLGGALALACTLDRGLLTKTLIFGVARRFAGRSL